MRRWEKGHTDILQKSAQNKSHLVVCSPKWQTELKAMKEYDFAQSYQPRSSSWQGLYLIRPLRLGRNLFSFELWQTCLNGKSCLISLQAYNPTWTLQWDSVSAACASHCAAKGFSLLMIQFGQFWIWEYTATEKSQSHMEDVRFACRNPGRGERKFAHYRKTFFSLLICLCAKIYVERLPT